MLCERKKQATALAQQLAKQATISQVALSQALKQLGRLLPCTDADELPELDLRVGIWQATQRDGQLLFTQNPDKYSWPGAWCDRETISPKKTTRIVMIGESVARGMHFDPFYTPSMVLEHNLKQSLGDSACEVIDLARIDGSMAYVKQTIPLSLQLEPDLIIVFAGNNWKNSVSFEPLADQCDKPLIQQLARFYVARDQSMDESIQDYLSIIEQTEALSGIPIVHVLPEFNLHDWQPKSLGECPFDDADQSQYWYQLYYELEQAIERGNTLDIERTANTLLTLDSVSASAPYLLGRHYVDQGNIEKARPLLERAADSEQVPRCTQAIQQTLRVAASQGQLKLIDLPKLLQEHQIQPNRMLFLDYCHMTAEGIQQTMGLITPFIAGYLSQPIIKQKFEPMIIDSDIQASGHFCGALYNGRFGQPYDLLYYHLCRALSTWPGLQSSMIAFLTHNCVPIAKGLHQAYQSQTHTRLHKIQQRLSIPKAHWTVIQSIKDALLSYDRTIHNKVDELLGLHFDASRGEGAVLTDQHLWQRYGQVSQPGGTFYLCHRPVFVAEFYLSQQTALSFDITLRLESHHETHSASIHCTVNGAFEQVIHVSSEWQQINITIEKHTVHQGVNTFSITWPIDSVRANQLRPVWGAIYQITATPLKESTPYVL